MKRLLITGGSGYLGMHLIPAAIARGWEVTAAYLTHPLTASQCSAAALDLRDAAAVNSLVGRLRPDVILHTACSNRNSDHIAAIVPAARNLAQAAREYSARLVHVSSDLVFDGKHPPYADDSPPAPLTPYALAKAEAETIVTELCPAAIIGRPSLIWGFQPLDHQTRWLVDGLRRGERITLFGDEIRCPVYVHDLCAALLELADRPDLNGPFNLGGPQALSRWDFGRKLLEALGIEWGENLVCGSAAAAAMVRPRDLTMLSERAAQGLTVRLRSVDSVLKDLRSIGAVSRP